MHSPRFFSLCLGLLGLGSLGPTWVAAQGPSSPPAASAPAASAPKQTSDVQLEANDDSEAEELPAPATPGKALADLEKRMLAARPRQYFRRWEKSPSGSYFSKQVYYKPNPKVAIERRQYIIFYPNEPAYLYLYDPEEKVYWGRIARHAPADVSFREIAASERRNRLANIPEPAYGPVGPLPKLPGAVDDLRLLPPTETAALLAPGEEADDDPTLAAEVRPLTARLKPRPTAPAPREVRVIPPLPPPYHYEYETVIERRWVPTWTFTQTVIHGQLVTVPVQTGYWKEVPVKRKKRVSNY